jgi:hypothetical protein
VSPILGIYASQISGHLFAPSGAYDSIATVTLGSAQSSITFSSIPSTYTHLQIRWLAKTSYAALGDYGIARLNGDTTGTNYRSHTLYGTGAGAFAETTVSQFNITAIPGNTNASMFGVGVMDILDYANTNKYKTTRTLLGYDQNTASTNGGYVSLNSSLWMSTSAVNEITISPGVGPNFVQYSQFALYGVKGS